ncbi:GNAT family N-acetyltransferase [Mangrovibacterium lignilyticum]|uniref:GNAT family N-acetyltransferase n=1 Tax=Mangrovibacterium lignilyticum TaxID=2668052 RepID=UPI0013D30434|nr:GNAT family N-acetyltransferase [Mangrovibacterium lignilyticum]
MISIDRTDSSSPAFRQLIPELDRELRGNYEFDQDIYNQYNIVDNIANVVVAFDGQKPVGCGCFKFFSPTIVELKRMFVLREFRGKGISKMVLAELEKWAAELGYSAAVLETGELQREAIGLYQKSGYISIPNYGPYVGLPHSHCFKKEFSSI